jgi:hypothetical protein
MWQCNNFSKSTYIWGAHGSIVGWGTLLQAGRSPVRVLDEVDFFNLPNPSSHTMALGSTQPLTEVNLPGLKRSQCVGLTNLLPSVSQMSDNVGAPTSCNPKGLHGLYRAYIWCWLCEAKTCKTIYEWQKYMLHLRWWWHIHTKDQY